MHEYLFIIRYKVQPSESGLKHSTGPAESQDVQIQAQCLHIFADSRLNYDSSECT